MILLTGADGFVGRATLQALEYRQIAARPYVGRINDTHALQQQMDGVETIIHLATAEGTGRVRSLRHVDVEGTQRLVEAAVRAGVNHIVYLSWLGATEQSLYPVLRTKGTVEKIIVESGLPYTILRSSTIFGRGDHFLTPILSLAVWNWPFVWLPSGGRTLVQPIWVQDVARCLLTVSDPLDLAGYRGKTIPIAGSERLHYYEVVNEVLQTAGLNRRLLPLQMQWVRIATRLLFGWRRRPPVTLFFLNRLAQPEIAELEIVSRVFGFQPARLRDQIAFLRQTGLRWYVFGR